MASFLTLPSYLAGVATSGDRWLEVTNPWDNSPAGRVACIGREQLEATIATHLVPHATLTRYERSRILNRTRDLIEARRDEFARLITAESGLCLRESRYEVGRACDVFTFAAIEALRDDGQVFSCDISPSGKARKIFTLREPLPLIGAITPFNHPLNQVAHKLAPAIAAGSPVILKPSEKTPLTAVRAVETLYETELPGWMLSCVHGTLDDVARPLIRDERVSLITFTGSVAVGREIAATAGFKKTCLELGGHAPLIVLEDADLELAAKLACEGCFRNSGQRCTAVRRLLVQESVVAEFTRRFVALAKSYVCGHPADEATLVGTVIDERAAIALEAAVHDALKRGAVLLLGGQRRGAVIDPTILAGVSRESALATRECFGPIAPIIPVRDLDDAIECANSTPYGLSSSIVTRSLESAIKAVKGIQAGTVNVNEIPGFRLELTPFGGIKNSGVGIKEGVLEAIKIMTNVKTYSLPW